MHIAEKVMQVLAASAAGCRRREQRQRDWFGRRLQTNPRLGEKLCYPSIGFSKNILSRLPALLDTQ